MNEHIVSKLKLNDFVKNYRGLPTASPLVPKVTNEFPEVEAVGLKTYRADIAYLKSFSLKNSKQKKSELMKDIYAKNHSK